MPLAPARLRLVAGAQPLKCVLPSARTVLPRPRVFRLLEPAEATRITWIAAPAGSGKTSVLTSFLQARPTPSLWYQVDESDDDPATLFLALAAGATRGALVLPPYDASCEPRLRAFSRQFAAALVARHGGDLLLAVDDFHLAPRPAELAGVLRDMTAFVPGLKVLVASRLEPPPALSRMRMHGQLALLAWPELRLTVDESARLLGLPAARGERLLRLHRDSDGWAAGLLLLARRDAWPEAGLPPDAPERGLLDDYLAVEVFGHATPEQRRALAATALLPVFDESSLGELLGPNRPADLLRDLQALPFFMRRQDPAGTGWTHHPLLRDFLLRRIDHEFAAPEAAALRRRAAGLLLAGGDVDAGLRLLRDHAPPAELTLALRQHAVAWLAQGRAASVEAWISRLPQEVLDEDPWLDFWLGKARTPRSPAAAIEPLERAAQSFRRLGDRRGCLLVCAAIAEAVGYGYADLKRLEPWLAEAATLVPELDEVVEPDARADVMGALFAALVARQRPHPLLAAWRERALTLADASARPTLRAQVLFAATMSHVWAGDYAAATRLGDRLREVLSAPGVAALPLTSGWLVLSVLAGNQPGPTPDYADVEAGLRASRETGVRVWDAELHGQAAVIALCHGDRARAGAALAAMRRVLPVGASVHGAGFHCFSAWSSLLADEPAAAAEAAAAAALEAKAASSEPLARHAAVMAVQAAMALGRSDEASRQLESLAEGERRTANPRGRFVRLLLEAERARRDGRLDDAVATLRPALELGRESGYVAYYGWLPKTMAALALLALRHGIEVEYVRSLIARRGLVADASAVDVEVWPWPVRISTLGAVRIEGLAAPAKAGVRTPHKPIELLLALVAFGGRDVAEGTICDALWPDAEGDAARRALDVTLHRVRRLFGDVNAVTLVAGRLGVDDSRIWIDVRALERVLDLGSDATDSPAAALDRLLDLYRGPFLRDEPAAWAARRRAQLRRRFVAAVTLNLRVLVDCGRSAEALPRALRACEAEPDDKALAAALEQVEAASASAA